MKELLDEKRYLLIGENFMDYGIVKDIMEEEEAAEREARGDQ